MGLRHGEGYQDPNAHMGRVQSTLSKLDHGKDHGGGSDDKGSDGGGVHVPVSKVWLRNRESSHAESGVTTTFWG